MSVQNSLVFAFFAIYIFLVTEMDSLSGSGKRRQRDGDDAPDRRGKTLNEFHGFPPFLVTFCKPFRHHHSGTNV